MADQYRLATQALHAGQVDDPTTHARAVPIYATSSYNFTSTEHAANLFALKEFGNIYSRLMNPTNGVLEKRLAALDGGVAGLAFASGQAAITAAILTITHSGQNIVSATSLYGGTWTLFTQTFKKLGVEVRFFDPDHPHYANARKYLPNGQGAIVGFGVKGGKEAGIKFINSVKLASHLANIGDAKTRVIHPASTTHSQLTPQEQQATGVTPEFVRISVGIEDLEDIKADLDQALVLSQKQLDGGS